MTHLDICECCRIYFTKYTHIFTVSQSAHSVPYLQESVNLGRNSTVTPVTKRNIVYYTMHIWRKQPESKCHIKNLAFSDPSKVSLIFFFCLVLPKISNFGQFKMGYIICMKNVVCLYCRNISWKKNPLSYYNSKIQHAHAQFSKPQINGNMTALKKEEQMRPSFILT